MTEKEIAYIQAVGNRCSVSEPDNPCFDCKVVNTSGDYINELEAYLKEARDELTKAKQKTENLQDFARQVIKDKYILSKFGAYINLAENTRDPENIKIINRELIKEFEERTLAYFYSENKSLHIATVVEGGGRNQIRTYGEYLLKRPLKPV